jgi:hypothetical protein
MTMRRKTLVVAFVLALPACREAEECDEDIRTEEGFDRAVDLVVDCIEETYPMWRIEDPEKLHLYAGACQKSFEWCYSGGRLPNDVEFVAEERICEHDPSPPCED